MDQMMELPPDHAQKHRRWRWICGGALLALLLLLLWVAGTIVRTGTHHATGNADVAIILGAAVDGQQPSPVFEQRIRHGIALYQQGRVRYVLMTGGRADDRATAESEVAQRMALAAGIPADAILIEDRSRTTRQNLVEAQRLMRGRGLRSAFIVSDPLHMDRALRMAHGLNMDAKGAPTPTSAYRSWSTKLPFLARETWFTFVYWAIGV